MIQKNEEPIVVGIGTWRNVQTEYCEKNCILTFTNIANLKLQ